MSSGSNSIPRKPLPARASIVVGPDVGTSSMVSAEQTTNPSPSPPAGCRGDNDEDGSFPPLYDDSVAAGSVAGTSETVSLSDLSVSENAKATGDGRFNINIDSRLVRAMSRAYPRTAAPMPSSPPPEYSLISTTTWNIALNIVIQVVGSRGDVQPFVALGSELKKYGHRVRLATHPVFESFVKDSGLEFFSIGGDPSELMAYMVKNPGLIPSMESVRKGDIQKNREMMSEMLDGCWRSCIEPDATSQAPFVADAIIANPPSYAHVHCAQALGIPLHLMFTMPWSSTRAFPHPLANIKSSKLEAEMANFLSYNIVDWMTWRGLGDIINKWRKTIGLEAVAEAVGPFLSDILKVPFTYCWSPALVPKPFDWPGHIDVCGFFFRDTPQYTPSNELDSWLRAGSTPIYIGFGSIVIDDPVRLTQIILEAVKSAGVRAIISRGWSKIGGPENTEDIFYLDDCPHEWLFQQVSAVIHHGGAGTTACGLLNACPTFIVPFFGDQPFWGSMIAKAGAGPRPIGQKELNAQNLTEAITFLLQPNTATAATSMSEKMKIETGVKTAADSFHRNLPADLMRCDLIPTQPAVWAYAKGRAMLKLSKIAGEILIGNSKLEKKALKAYGSHIISTDNQRWDPVTGFASASVGTGADLVRWTAGMFLDPIDVYRQGRKDAAKRGQDSMADKGKLALSMTGASTKSMGKLIGGFYKSTIVDIPLACTEGFQAIPTLYGEEKKDLGRVTDWKSGLAVAGKNFAYGFTGISDLVVKPYEGAKKGGALGAIKGAGIGLSNVGTKMVAGTMGTVAFSGQGIYKSLHTVTHSSARKAIIEARIKEGEYLVKINGVDASYASLVIGNFDKARAEMRSGSS